MKEKLVTINYYYREHFDTLRYVTHNSAASTFLDLSSGERSTTNCPAQLDPNQENNSLYKLTGMPGSVYIAWQEHTTPYI